VHAQLRKPYWGRSPRTRPHRPTLLSTRGRDRTEQYGDKKNSRSGRAAVVIGDRGDVLDDADGNCVGRCAMVMITVLSGSSIRSPAIVITISPIRLPAGIARGLGEIAYSAKEGPATHRMLRASWPLPAYLGRKNGGPGATEQGHQAPALTGTRRTRCWKLPPDVKGLPRASQDSNKPATPFGERVMWTF